MRRAFRSLVDFLDRDTSEKDFGERGVFVDGRTSDDAEAFVDHWGLAENDKVEILGDKRVDIDVGKRHVGRESIGQLGYRGPLVFIGERLDCFDSGFGD